MSRRQAAHGQGVIEYAGALIVAVILVSLAMTASFNDLSTIFDTIFTAVSNVIAPVLATL